MKKCDHLGKDIGECSYCDIYGNISENSKEEDLNE